MMILNRRDILIGSAGLAVSSLARPARAMAQVFGKYDQKALDAAYDQSVWAPDGGAMIEGYARDSLEVRKKYPPQSFSYGPGKAETLDVFVPPGAADAPVFVFIHGGAWRGLTKEDVSAPAPLFLGAGAIYVAINFDNIPTVTLAGMIDQCRRAIAWISLNCARFSGSSAKLFAGGHSSGGHLAAVMLTTDWTEWKLPREAIRGGVILSGLGDLHAPMLSSRGRYLKLSAAEVEAFSPVRHMARLRCPTIVAWGTKESPEFRRQGQVMADVIAGMGLLRERLVLKGVDHFEMPNQLLDDGSEMSRSVLGLIRG